jgi:hypothetical protein
MEVSPLGYIKQIPQTPKIYKKPKGTLNEYEL